MFYKWDLLDFLEKFKLNYVFFVFVYVLVQMESENLIYRLFGYWGQQ